ELVGAELSRAVKGPVDVVGSNVEDWPARRSEDGARAVAVHVVERAPQVGPACHSPPVGILANRHAAGKLHAGGTALVVHVLIGVGEIRKCRKNDGCLWTSSLGLWIRTDEEGDGVRYMSVFFVRALHDNGVCPGGSIIGDL